MTDFTFTKTLFAKNIWQFNLSLIFSKKSDTEILFEKASKFIEENSLKIIAIEIFAPESFPFKNFSGNFFMPKPLWILPLENTEENSPFYAGMNIVCLKNANVEPINENGENYGVNYELDDVNFTRATAIYPDKKDATPKEQTSFVIDKMAHLLKKFSNGIDTLARTWFFNEKILDWYDDFNFVRTTKYNDLKIFDNTLPASTGIGGPNIFDTKLALGFISANSDKEFLEIKELSSPLQCSACDYKSSFARAVAINTKSASQVFVSGTASIFQNGETAYYGDVDKQIKLTLDVIKGILNTQNMDFKDTVRAIVYCEKPEYYNNFLNFIKENPEYSFIHIPAYNTVCRKDLHFEVELDAIKPK